ncbi:restriction endonuclease subunit S [Orenia marismortui]|uniref:Type I restriction modification DNA specificity protein n=1 Tax=Orenia marismortui TaxID=46469 RepID=A0A4V6QB71_9FIRM|nr:restriction endonuclease subunit S [Orenia marismortui]TDX48866.1 type I restriction modification DNA specificity protein [Orenia marismortui]
MKTELNDRNWEEFFLTDVFSINSTSSGIDKNKLIRKNGTIPYITRTELNNGCDLFIGEQEEKYKKDKSNVITIGLDTQTVFYQNKSFYTGQNIQILSNPNLNKYNAQFIIKLLKIQMKKFNWGGNGATLTRLKRSKILLPISDNRQPDYEFMENYMKAKEQVLIKRYKNYISKRLDKLKSYLGVKSLSEKEWKEFDVPDIFPKLQRGKRLKKADHIPGKMPYVSSTAENNGIDDYVSNDEDVRIFSNCLTLANSGSVGSCFYQPFEVVASDHVTHLKNNDLNKYSYLFISQILSRLGEKYSFNREISDKRLKREKIFLPTNEAGEPDYKYMENYMKKIEYKKIKEYLQYLEKKFE